jgi:excisionase family DNA binding protein
MIPDTSPHAVLAVPPIAVCKMLSLGLTSVYELMRTGELRSFRIGRTRRITMESVEGYIERQAKEPVKLIPAQVKRGRGRPRTGNAQSAAERMRRYHARLLLQRHGVAP